MVTHNGFTVRLCCSDIKYVYVFVCVCGIYKIYGYEAGDPTVHMNAFETNIAINSLYTSTLRASS